MEIRLRENGRIRELIVDGEVVSWLIVADYRIRIGTAQVRMAGIGGVGTKEDQRMKGYSRKLVEDALVYIRKEKYDVSMLFGIPDFYSKFGYAVCMASHKMIMSTKNAENTKSDTSGYRIRGMEDKDIGSIIELYDHNYKNKTCSLVRMGEYKFTKGTRYDKSVECFIVEDDDDNLIGYGVLEKNDSEVNIVEVESWEVGVFSDIIYELSQQAKSRGADSLAFYLPPDHPFVQYAIKYGCEFISQFHKDSGGMMRIINQDSFLGKLEGFLQDKLNTSKNNFAGDIQIKTDIDDTIIKLGKQHLDEVKYSQSIILEIPQHKLIQLIVGYMNIMTIVNDSDVNVTGDIDVLNCLFTQTTVPFMPYSDQF